MLNITFLARYCVYVFNLTLLRGRGRWILVRSRLACLHSETLSQSKQQKQPHFFPPFGRVLAQNRARAVSQNLKIKTKT